MEERIVGRFEGQERGPLFVVLGAIHGNEPAGVRALELMFKMLEVEPITNPGFVYRGRMIGLVGNLRAYREGVRYLRQDMNRCWTRTNWQFVQELPVSERVAEEREMVELIDVIQQEIADYRPEVMYVLDLHTTSAPGGIFCVVADRKRPFEIALDMNVPVITGLTRGLDGTTVDFFRSRNLPVKTHAVVFESGGHHEPLSVNRAIAAIANCMRSIGAVNEHDIESIHDQVLRQSTKELPHLSHLMYTHRVSEEVNFRMRPGYVNFQEIEQGEYLADDRHGPVLAPMSGRILMPLYQRRGSDGFFIIQEQEEPA